MNRKSQLGMGFISLLFMLLIGLFFAVLIFRIGPVYLEYFNVVSSMTSLQEDKILVNSNDEPVQISRVLKDRLVQRLQVNDVRSVEYKNINIKYDHEGYKVQVIYDRQVNVMYNIFALIKFDKQILVTADAQ